MRPAPTPTTIYRFFLIALFLDAARSLRGRVYAISRMKELSGAPVSAGMAIGKAFLFTGDDFPEIPKWQIKKSQSQKEWQRFCSAIEALSKDIKKRLADFQKNAAKDAAQEQSALLQVQLAMLEDDEFQTQVKTELEKELFNIEWTLSKVSSCLMARLLDAKDPYLRERTDDIRDITREIINKLLGIERFSLADIDEDLIIVAHDLMPSETLKMNKTHVKALVMDSGSATSHTAILARAFDIPAVLGLSTCTKEISSGDTLVVDGNAGKVYVNPDKAILEKYKSAIINFEKTYIENFNLSGLGAETLDGHSFSLQANIELPEEAAKAFKYGAEGIGLFRSEFLFLNSGGKPSEEKQFLSYSAVVRAAGKRPVRIRTCDLGGDKVLPVFFANKEKNPLLGWRAIRLTLSTPEFFKEQLRAVLRASALGNVELLFPLISSVEEFDAALALLDEAREECLKKGEAVGQRIKAGLMIEVPSAALSADILAKKADFFSIGTNDLIQYTLAVDRGNEKVNYLARTMQPAVLRLIKMTIDAAHNEGKKAAMCGEMAGIARFAPLLVGLGLDEFSMSASAIPELKRILRAVKKTDCELLAQDALKCGRSLELENLLDDFMRQIVYKEAAYD